jgi:hypothetical protein
MTEMNLLSMWNEYLRCSYRKGYDDVRGRRKMEGAGTLSYLGNAVDHRRSQLLDYTIWSTLTTKELQPCTATVLSLCVTMNIMHEFAQLLARIARQYAS